MPARARPKLVLVLVLVFGSKGLYYQASRPYFVGNLVENTRSHAHDRFNIWISSTLFVKFLLRTVTVFALGVFVFLKLPRIWCPAQKSWQVAGHDEDIPLWFLCCHLGESKAKASSSGWRLTAFSHSSQGFGGHDISVLFERTATRISRPICCISLTLGGVSLLSN